MPAPKSRVNPRQTRPQQRTADLDKRIQTHWPEMPASEQRIAELLLNAPGSLVSHNATELAELAKTSKAAISRLIHRLGYQSFAQARQQVRAAQDWGSPLYLGVGDEPLDQTNKGLLAQQFSVDSLNLDKTWRAQSEETLHNSIHAICKARRVVLLGYRNSGYLAMYFATQLSLLRDEVSVASTSSDSLVTSFYELDPSDLVIGVGLRRRVPMFMRALTLIRQKKVPLLIITDPSGLSMTKPSDLVMTCYCQSKALFDSYAAPMSVMNVVLGQVATQLGEKGRTRLRSIEDSHRALNDLI